MRRAPATHHSTLFAGGGILGSARAAFRPTAGGIAEARPVGEFTMSAPPFGTMPTTNAPDDQSNPTGLGVSSRLVHLDPGIFSLSLLPGPTDRGMGLPAARVSVSPGPPGRREAVSISTFRGDGWLTSDDEPTLFRVLSGGADVLVTLYWSTLTGAATPPALKLVRLNPEGAVGGLFDTTAGAGSGGPAGASAPGHFVGQPGSAVPPPPGVRGAEIVAHVEGIGDVDGRIGEWVGVRGSGRAIEGFSLTPRQGFSPEDFEIRAVLGRDWLSPWLPGGSFCGSRGLALPLRGFCLRLRPAAAARYDIACLARFVDGSEVGPVGSDRVCAAPSLAALEAFQVTPRARMA
jgi:hypothetical protein